MRIFIAGMPLLALAAILSCGVTRHIELSARISQDEMALPETRFILSGFKASTSRKSRLRTARADTCGERCHGLGFPVP